jgi:hypothetical protein
MLSELGSRDDAVLVGGEGGEGGVELHTHPWAPTPPERKPPAQFRFA